MKTIAKTTLFALGATLALGFSQTPAHAADATSPAHYYNWDRAYIGGHLGWGWGDTQWTNLGPGAFWGAIGSGGTLDPDGFLGGAQIGYMHQRNNLVFGVDISLSGADINETIISPTFPLSDTWSVDIDALLLAQARLGWTHDNWLFFVQAGYAGADASATATSALGPTNVSVSQWHNGWTIGAGLMFQTHENFSLGAEYNYVDLGSETYDLFVPVTSQNTGIDHEIHVFKITGNFHLRDIFGGR